MSKIKFGLRIPSFPIDGSSKEDFIDQIITFLKVLNESYDSAWISDYFIPWTNIVNANTPVLEAFSTISYLSGVFQNLDFGNIVLCNSYRSPALLAKIGATLQTLLER